MSIFNDLSYTQDQVDLANQNALNKHFVSQNNNLWFYQDSQASLRLRYAVIQNPSIVNSQEKNSLDLTNIYNPNTGGITVSWFQNNNGGVQGAEDSSGNWEVNADQTNISVKDRQQDYKVSSTVPNVRLSSPFIWTGDDNRCCGFNYVPPNNSIVLMGNKEFNQPVMLGYVPSNPSVLYPVLKPGEISISGYGNNFIHWGQSDKISIYCKSKAGEVDIDDPDYIKTGKGKVNAADCELEININANNRFIEIRATEENGSLNKDFDKNSFNEKQVSGNQFTKILITPTDIEIRTTDDNNNESYVKIASDSIMQYVRQLDAVSTIETNKDGINYKMQQAESFFDNNPFLNEGTITAKNVDYVISNNENETYCKADNENIKIKTKYYTVEAEEVNINSKNTTNIWSDNELNLSVPYNNTTRIDIDGNEIELNTDHEEDDDSIHKQKNPYNNDRPMDYKVNISGCNVKIKEHESNHGEVI